MRETSDRRDKSIGQSHAIGAVGTRPLKSLDRLLGAVFGLLRGLLLGSLFAPGFWLSSAGALVSLTVLALARHLPSRHFGPVSLSVLAAFGHIGGQLALVGVWLLPAAALIKLLPVFAAAALVFGTVNGLIVTRMLAAPAPDGRQSASCTLP